MKPRGVILLPSETPMWRVATSGEGQRRDDAGASSAEETEGG